MKHLLEDNNISVKEDTDVFGQVAKAGAKIICVSKQGEYNGLTMRVPPPEFEALMLFNSLEAAAKSESVKKLVETSKSADDQLLQVTINDSNHANFFQTCQNAMTAITFSVSALESWANKSIFILGQIDGKPSKLILKRPGKPDREVSSDKVAEDQSISIRPKLFQLIPQVFGATPLKESSTLRNKIISLVDERNIVMHMQQKLTIAKEETERVSFAIKLFKVNTFLSTENAIIYMSYIYENSVHLAPDWLIKAESELKNLKKKLK
jgi:hypothetical protein